MIRYAGIENKIGESFLSKRRKEKRKISKLANVILIWGMLLCMVGCQTRKPCLYVNGEIVSEEEVLLLDEEIERVVQMKVLQQWAKESGVVETLFSYQEMLQRMEQENQLRAEQKEAGGIVYGVLKYTPLQFYNVEMGQYERLLKDQIILTVSEEELRDWYDTHQENYWQIGEIQGVLTIRADGRVLSEQEILLSSYNFRTLSEQNEELVNVLVDLPAGEEAVWTDEYNQEWTLLCTSREDGTYQLFEEVMGAVSEQYANEKLEQEWKERIAVSVVEDLRK